MKDATFKPTVLYLIALIICGSNGIVASLINLPSYQIVFFRMLLGTLFLLTVKFVQKEAFTIQKYPKDFQALIGSGVALGLQWTFLFEAYQLVGVGIATLEYYCGPVIVMVLTPFLFGEKFTTKKILGFLVVVIGAALIIGYGVGLNLSPTGLLLGALSAVLYAIMVICNRQLKNVSGIEGTSIQLGIGCAVVALVTIVFHSIELPADPASVNWLAVLTIGLFNTGLGSFLYFPQLTKIPVQRVAVFGYLEPLSAVIFSALILGEPFGLLKIIGTACIIGGAIFAELSGASPNKSEAIETPL